MIKQAQDCFGLCKKHFVFGTGAAEPCFGESQSKWQSILTQWISLLRNSEYIGVRGPYSARILTEAGLNNVEVVGDPVLAFAEQSMPDESTYETSVIGLNAASIRGGLWGDMEHVVKQFESIAVIAKKEGWAIKWFVV